MKRATDHLLGVATLVLAGAAIATVAAATLVATPESADATIFDLDFGERSSTERFVDVLERLGHEPPRPFSLNDNVVYVSVARSSKPPRALLANYQHALDVDGVNAANVGSVEAARTEEGLRTGLTGGLVPTRIQDHYVSMAGVVPANGAGSADELAELAKLDASERFVAFRSVEAFREPGSSWTTVIATFSDETFDYRKMTPGDGDATYDAEVLACPGCVRLQRFEDLSDADHMAHIYTTSFSRDATVAFYRRAYLARGWELDEATSGYAALAARSPVDERVAGRLEFVRAERRIAVNVMKRPGGGAWVDIRSLR